MSVARSHLPLPLSQHLPMCFSILVGVGSGFGC